MIHFFGRLLITVAALLIISYFLPGVLWIKNLGSALAAAFLLGLVNALIRPVLVLLTLPLTLLTFGLFLFVLNACLLWIVSALVGGFYVNGFWGAMIGSVLISIVTWVFSHLLRS